VKKGSSDHQLMDGRAMIMAPHYLFLLLSAQPKKNIDHAIHHYFNSLLKIR
jgi:hypothetical protein